MHKRQQTPKGIRYSYTASKVLALTLAASFLCFAQAPSLGKFAGTWTEDESKRSFGSTETLKFRADTKGNLEELRGADAKPLVQPVRFGEKPYTIDASTNSIAWKQIDKTHFERKLFDNGKLLTTREIQLSDDGKTLTEETARTLNGGKKQVITIRFHRTKGEGQGLAGIWQADSYHSTVPTQWTYSMMGDQLMMVDSTGVTLMLSPDGKPSEVKGPAVISGTMAALKPVSSDKLDMIQSRQGVTTGKVTLTLSGDGKVLTLSAVNLAPHASAAPSVTVFKKQ
jgi:hypothetical protein